MDISQLLNRNRLPRKQKGEVIETATAFFGRYYHTTEDGTRRQKAVKLADKSDLYRSKNDVAPLMERLMLGVNSQTAIFSGQATLTEYIEIAIYLGFARIRPRPRRTAIARSGSTA